MTTFFLIIPAYNEEKNIAAVIEKAKKFAENLIIVDDGSKDQTANAAGRLGAMVIRHPVNLGKGAALRTGAQYACGKGAGLIAFMDSDGQHDPADLPRILDSLKGNEIVFTYRERSIHMPLIKKIGNSFIDALMKLLFGINIKDTQCGYKAMTREAYEKLQLDSNDYSIESEIAAKAGKYRLKHSQVPIKTVYTDKYKGTTVFDGINIVMKMLWWRLSK